LSRQHWKRIALGIGMSSLLLLAACSEEDKEQGTEEPKQEDVEKAEEKSKDAAPQSNMELSMEDIGEIKEAEGIPAEDKQAILDSFNQYIEAFNQEDIETYMKVISKTPINFTYEEEEKYVKSIFDQVDSKRTTENTTIINYAGKKADVYSEITAVTTDPDNGKEATRSGRQVSVFHKDGDGNWKLAAIFFIANPDEENGESEKEE
jgi:ketosteroid isomerase-like protein